MESAHRLQHDRFPPRPGTLPGLGTRLLVPPNQRVPALDGVRGLAAITIVAWHYLPSHLHVPPGQPIGYLAKALGIGWTGVDLFFVLSGVLIGGVLIDHRRASGYFAAFYIRRGFRILPVFFLVFGAFLAASWLWRGKPALAPLLEPPMPLASYLTFTQNFFMAHRGVFGAQWLTPTWSLAVEEQFYLILPLTIWLCPPRWLRWAAVSAIAAAPCWRHFVGGFTSFLMLPCRLDSLMTGVLVADLARDARFRRHWPRVRPLIWAGIGAGFAWALTELRQGGSMERLTEETWKLQLTGYALWYGMVLLMIAMEPRSIVGRGCSFRPLAFLGAISYGLYLLHEPVEGLMHAAIFHRSPLVADWRHLGVAAWSALVTLLLAMALNRWVEAPMIARGRRWQYGAKRP